MVNSPHETHHRAFQQIPELFTSAFRLLDIPVPGEAVVTAIDSDVREVRPVERHVDTLLRLEFPGGHTYLLLVEAQTKPDKDKPDSWAYYLSYLRNRYGHQPILAATPAGTIWRNFVETCLFSFRSYVAENLRKQGYIQGRAQGLRMAIWSDAVIQILEVRGFPLSEDTRHRILTCGDQETLDLWFDRAPTATSLDELFAAPAEG
ncbi:hypothetical protein [Streptomyces sp. B5E4]|uniref:hypothetical protein n=1 Tax=Streptomyces sp. B5E4 TaxID=3153568 RepID=UPI00325D0674